MITSRNPFGLESLESRRLLTATLLNELKINAPSFDGPFEYAELKGDPAAALSNLYFVSVEGDSGTGTGDADMVVALDSQSLGSNGLLVIKASVGGHTVPAATIVVGDPQLNPAAGGLENGSNSFLLISSTTPIVEGTDYDTNDDGVLDLPAGAVVADAVGWSDGGAGDFVYGGVSLIQNTGIPPDAATRLAGNTTANSAAAWYCADIAGATNDSVVYNPANSSVNFPSGGALTPGADNVPDPVPAAPRLNELKVNPPAGDQPFEYVELKGDPSQFIAHLFFVSMEGDSEGNPGAADMVTNLSGTTMGANGLLMIKAVVGGHTPPAATAVVTDAQLSAAGVGIENGSNSFLLVASLTTISEGTDYDTNNDGVLELPAGAFLVDAVGWSDGSAADFVYGGVALTQTGGGAADAATRFVNDDTPFSAAAWYSGDQSGALNTSLSYNPAAASANFPSGGGLTPGDTNIPPVNRPPENSLPASANTDEDTALVFSTANANLISVDDPDAGTDAIQVALSATHGILTLSQSTGLSFTLGANGTSSMTFKGTLGDIDAALDGLTFAPAGNYSGPAALTIDSNDLGHNGLGGAMTDSDTLPIDVNPVADAPTLAVTDAEGFESTPIPLDIAAALTDTDGSETLSILIANVPTGATLSAGTDNLDGTWTLAPGDLAGLKITVPDDASFNLDVTATATETANGDTADTSKSLHVLVKNVNPIIDSFTTSSPDCGGALEGQAVTISAAFSDVGVLDTHTAKINWGDGSAEESAAVTESGGSGTVAASHVYANGGIYTVTLNVKDDDGGSAVPKTAPAVVSGVGVMAGQLQIIGTDKADHITVNTANGQIKVNTDFLPATKSFPAASITRILAVLCDGNDQIQFAGNIATPTVIDGGKGNDQLNGGNGLNVLIGGAGVDMLLGGSSSDLLIGGTDADRIIGNAGNDVLVAGTTDLDGNYSALSTLLATYAGGGPLGLSAVNTHDDGVVDTLTGSAGTDTFLFNKVGGILDTVTDQAEIGIDIS